MLTRLPLKLLSSRGVLNVVHGTHDVVNRILDHPDVKAVSFVGSSKAGKYVYEVRECLRQQLLNACSYAPVSWTSVNLSD